MPCLDLPDAGVKSSGQLKKEMLASDYGKQPIMRLADALQKQKIPACERTRLYAYLSFYRVYPQIREAVSRELGTLEIPISGVGEIFRSATGKSTKDENKKQSLLENWNTKFNLQLLAIDYN